MVTGLPVAAYDGSLEDRFDDSPAGAGPGQDRHPPGTSALAGITTDARGHALVFAFVSNHMKCAETLDTRAALDGLATPLATCRC